MSTYVYYMNSSLVSSSVCIGSSTDHRPTCLGIALLAVPSLDSVEVLVLVVLSLVMVVVLSGPCRVFIWLFSRLPRKEGQYYTTNPSPSSRFGHTTNPSRPDDTTRSHPHRPTHRSSRRARHAHTR